MQIYKEAIQYALPGGDYKEQLVTDQNGHKTAVGTYETPTITIDFGGDNVEFPHRSMAFRKIPEGDRTHMIEIGKRYINFLKKSKQADVVVEVYDATTFVPSLPALWYDMARLCPFLYGKAVGKHGKRFVKEKIKQLKSYR